MTLYIRRDILHNHMKNQRMFKVQLVLDPAIADNQSVALVKYLT